MSNPEKLGNNREENQINKNQPTQVNPKQLPLKLKEVYIIISSLWYLEMKIVLWHNSQIK